MSTAIIPDKITLDDITHWAPESSCARLQILRLDKIHPLVSGNKWFKLRLNLEAAKADGCTTVLTFGGPFSNHLLATAVAAGLSGLRSIGIVRGEDAALRPGSTLVQCGVAGMQLYYVSRSEYGDKENGATCKKLQQDFGKKLFVIPEGGANEWGRRGAEDIAGLIPDNATHICLPVGSGTTITGLLRKSKDRHVLGFPALADHSLSDLIPGGLQETSSNCSLTFDYTFRGFARTTPELISFMRSFSMDTGIKTDIVYTGKMMYGIADMLRKKAFLPHSEICCIHTGGPAGKPAGLI